MTYEYIKFSICEISSFSVYTFCTKQKNKDVSMDEIYDVVIIGGGPSGLSAAQELTERNLKVCVLEASPFLGGKPIAALTYPYKCPKQSANKEEVDKFLKSPPSEDRTVENKLPVEHGFRVYPESYNNLLSIMRRIPTEDGRNVSDNLTNALHLAEYEAPIQNNKKWWHRILAKFEKVLFGLGLYTPYVVCYERSLKYDEIPITELFNLDERSPELQSLIVCLTDSLSSGMINKASSLAVINILMNYYYAPGRTGFRTFDRPTHLAWLQPWEKHLRGLGVTFHLNTRVVSFNLQNPDNDNELKVSEVIAIQNGEKKIFKGKYVICATPADVLQKLLSSNYEMLRYDGRLTDIYRIMTLPATGVQLFYDKPIKGLENKLLAGSMVTHPWGISYVEQNSYWTDSKKYTGRYGVVSIYVSVTNQIGRFIKKPLQKCTANEIGYEMFMEVEEEFKKRGIEIPERVGYFAHSYQNETFNSQEGDDPVVGHHFDGSYNEDLLHLCVIGMHKFRPVPETLYLNNFILCGSYTFNKTFYVSTMESAAESGRRAANTVLRAMNLQPVQIYEVDAPKMVKFLRGMDKVLYMCYLPNPLDLIQRLLRKTVKTKHIHMDPSIREFENLHW